jgi:tight adherence protein B
VGAFVLTVVLAAGAAWTVVEVSPRRRLILVARDWQTARGARAVGTDGRSALRTRTSSAAAGAAARPPAAVVGLAVVAAALLGGLLAVRSPALALLVPVLPVVLIRGGAARAARRAAQRRREAVVEVCTALAAELRAGQDLAGALVRAAGSGGAVSVIPSALAAAATAADIPTALRRDAAAAGAEALRQVAACWQVAGESGASMAPGLQRLAQALRAEESHRRSVTAALAAPRATAWLLAGLPVIAVLMGTGLGARPLHVLLGTPAGGVLLLAGLGLTAAGVVWTDRLARHAERA